MNKLCVGDRTILTIIERKNGTMGWEVRGAYTYKDKLEAVKRHKKLLQRIEEIYKRASKEGRADDA